MAETSQDSSTSRRNLEIERAKTLANSVADAIENGDVLTAASLQKMYETLGISKRTTGHVLAIPAVQEELHRRGIEPTRTVRKMRTYIYDGKSPVALGNLKPLYDAVDTNSSNVARERWVRAKSTPLQSPKNPSK